MFSKETYIERRRKLKEKMKHGIALFMGNGEMAMSYDGNSYPFIQDSTFLYFFGMDIPNLVGIIDFEKGEEYIFGTDFTLEDTMWMGPQKLLKEQVKEVGVDNFIEMDKLPQFVEGIKKEKKEIYHTVQYRDENRMKMGNILDIHPGDIDGTSSQELTEAIIEIRNTKTSEEIEKIEEAVDITRKMHLEAMKVVKPGMREYEVAAAVEAVAKKHDALTSFPTICTKHAEILHNHRQDYELQEGDLLLLDCGARTRDGYCGDMTTVMPVGGKFDERQKNMYALLIEVYEKVESILKPGITYREVHIEAAKTLAGGLVEREIMKGDIEEIVASGAHALFFPHGLGHMLGMDVHDMENLGETLVGYGKELEKSTQFGLKSLRLGRTLKPGYVFTVEPGIYFIPELIKKWRSEGKFKEYIDYDVVEKYLDFGGMRYEGDYVVTDTEIKRLGKRMPKYFYEVEEAMK